MNVTDRIVDVYKKEYDKNPVFIYLLTIFFVFFIIFVISAIITRGDTVYGMLDHARNTFSDYFESIRDSVDRPYTRGRVIYPPLVMVSYAVLGHFLTPFVNIEAGETLSVAILRDSQLGIMSFFILMFLVFYIFYVIFSRLTEELSKDMQKYCKILFLLIILSGPFIYGLERGNSIFFAMIFCFIFLMGYRSENKWIRYLSYAALGCAAGIKIYPALFGLLVLRDRKYKEFAICVAIVSALLFLPFVFTDGNPLILFDNVTSYVGIVDRNSGFINLKQITTVLFYDVLSASAINALSTVLILIVATLSAIVVIFDREMKFWKVTAIIACNLVLGPGIGSQYLFIYMTIPMLFFLISERDMNSMNKFYAIGFAAILVLVPGGIWLPGIVAIRTIFVILILASLFREGIPRVYVKMRNRSESDDVYINV